MTSLTALLLTLISCQGRSVGFCRARTFFVLASVQIRVRIQISPSSQQLSKVGVETECCTDVSKNQTENVIRDFTLSFPSDR